MSGRDEEGEEKRKDSVWDFVGEAKLRMTEHSARREQEKTAQSLLEY